MKTYLAVEGKYYLLQRILIIKYSRSHKNWRGVLLKEFHGYNLTPPPPFHPTHPRVSWPMFVALPSWKQSKTQGVEEMNCKESKHVEILLSFANEFSEEHFVAFGWA